MTLKVSIVPRGVCLSAVKGRSWLRKYICFCDRANVTSVWFLLAFILNFQMRLIWKLFTHFLMCACSVSLSLHWEKKKKEQRGVSQEMMANHPVPRTEKSILHQQESKHAHIANRFADLKLLVRWILGTFHDTVGCPADFPLTHDSQAVIYMLKEIKAADQIFQSVRECGK